MIVKQLLPLDLQPLFFQMTRGEQIHSIRVCKALMAEGERDPDLLEAALLHDIGKTIYPLKIWERVWIVLTKEGRENIQNSYRGISASSLKQYPWWKRAGIVAENHSEWGAQLLRGFQVNSQLIWLVQNHQERIAIGEGNTKRIQLEKLKQADDRC